MSLGGGRVYCKRRRHDVLQFEMSQNTENSIFEIKLTLMWVSIPMVQLRGSRDDDSSGGAGERKSPEKKNLGGEPNLFFCFQTYFFSDSRWGYFYFSDKLICV